MSKQKQFLVAREVESDDERRLREALARHADGFMTSLDAAMKLRTASGEASRMRALARTGLQDACLRAMEALALSKQ